MAVARDPAALDCLLRRARRAAWATGVLDAVPRGVAAFVAVALALRLAGRLDWPWPAAAFVATLLPAAGRRPTLRRIAGALDVRHATGDLLLSAWLTPATGPWSAALRARAEALAATLRPAGPRARVSPRQHACVAAGAVAVMAVVRLWPPAVAPAGTFGPEGLTPPAASGDAALVAAESGRVADTGQSPADHPGTTPAFDAGAGTGRRPSNGGADARGGGRADDRRVAALPLRPPTSDASPFPAASPAPGGDGPSATADRPRTGPRAVGGTPAAAADADGPPHAESSFGDAAAPGASATDATGASAPPRYRDLVREFFAH